MNRNVAARKIQTAVRESQEAFTNKVALEPVNRQFYVEWKTGSKVHRYKPSTFFNLIASDERLKLNQSETFADLLFFMLNNPNATFRDPFTRLPIRMKDVDIVIRGKKPLSDPDITMFNRALTKYKPSNIPNYDLDQFVGFMKGYQIQRETRLNNLAKLQTYLPNIVGDLIYPHRRVSNNNLNSAVRLGDKMYNRGIKVVRKYAENRSKVSKNQRNEYDKQYMENLIKKYRNSGNMFHFFKNI